MTALELADYFENDADGSVSDSNVAYMLRRQHEAIQKLREALANHFYSPCYAASKAAKQALADTENLT